MIFLDALKLLLIYKEVMNHAVRHLKQTRKTATIIDHIRIIGIGLELACNGGSPHKPQLQASSSPMPGIPIWPLTKTCLIIPVKHTV